jgi:hypothetical protein
MNPAKHATLALVTLFFITACGGGSSSDSGGGSSTQAETGSSTESTSSGSQSAPTTYTGSVSVVLTAQGFPPVPAESPLTVVIEGDTVTLTVEGESVTTTLNGNAFTAPIPVPEGGSVISCTGTAVADGTVSGNTVSGTVSGSGSCSDGSQEIPVSLSGSFNATS